MTNIDQNFSNTRFFLEDKSYYQKSKSKINKDYDEGI